MELRRDDLARAAENGAAERSERLASVQREIRQAQAEALGRTGERLQDLLDRLAELDLRIDALLAAPGESHPDRGRAETEARNRARDDAMLVRHHLMIQREALGIARQTPVEQCYPVPDRRRLPDRAESGGREP